MEEPKVIFLDAVGTLFGVRGSVGEIYSAIAEQAGVITDPELVNQAFYQKFKAASSPAFPGVPAEQIPELEFQWWEAIAKQTFATVGVLEQFTNFSSFFAQLYAYFASSQPWYVYPDVIPALQQWQQQGIELGIISNFDSRLHAVIELLELRSYFSSITISSITGSAKPDRQIFLSALNQHHCHPHQAWHIGDSLKEDYYGSKALGIRAFLIER